MWREERNRNRNRLGVIILMVEITAVVLILGAIGTYIWNQSGLAYVDKYLQLAFAGGVIFVIALIVNYLMSKRW